MQSACLGGWQPLAVDRFGDLDTRRLSLDWVTVAPNDQGQWLGESLLQAAEAMIERHSPVGWIYGSGLESCPTVIEAISRHCSLFGNPAPVVDLCTRPRAFFSLLDRLHIAYPPVAWKLPSAPDQWLFKRGRSHGGLNVFAATERPASTDFCYYQKKLSGPVYTYGFLAGSGRLCWGAFNRLYQGDYNARQPYLYGGAVNRAELSAEVESEVEAMARRLIEALQLKGMHGLDFMLAKGRPQVLELNPRPGAVTGLWDHFWSQGLIQVHIDLCRGQRPMPRIKSRVMGTKIVFARSPVRLPEAFAWPRWCSDLTPSGFEIGAGMPVCSVNSEGATVRQVEMQLSHRQAEVWRLLIDSQTTRKQ